MPPGKMSRHFVFSRCILHVHSTLFFVVLLSFPYCSFLNELSFSQTGLWLSYLIIFV